MNSNINKSENITRSLFSKIGITMLLLGILCKLAGAVITIVLQKFVPDISSQGENALSAVRMVISSLPFVILAYPVVKLSLKNENTASSIGVIGLEKIKAFDMLKLSSICIAAVYISGYLSILGGWMLSFVNMSSPISVPNPFIPSELFSTIIFYVILLPIVEEAVFRGVILRELLRFGVDAALFSSAFIYMLYSGAVDKLFPYFVCGIVFSYIAINTMSIKYSLALHSVVNLICYVIVPQLTLVVSKTGSFVVLGALALICVIGFLVFFFDFRKKIFVKRTEKERTDTAESMECFWMNAGMVLFIIFSLLEIFSISLV